MRHTLSRIQNILQDHHFCFRIWIASLTVETQEIGLMVLKASPVGFPAELTYLCWCKPEADTGVGSLFSLPSMQLEGLRAFVVVSLKEVK